MAKKKSKKRGGRDEKAGAQNALTAAQVDSASREFKTRTHAAASQRGKECGAHKLRI
jgi:hypothetical protein